VGAVDEAGKEADRQRVDADLLDQVAGPLAHLLDVDRDQDLAGPVDPLVDPGQRVAGNEVGHVELAVVVELGGARAAGEAEGVLEAARDQHPDAGAAQLGDRVGDHRRAVDHQPRLGQQPLEREAEVAGGDRDRVEHAAAVLVVGGERLAALDSILEEDGDVGVGAAHVDADDGVLGPHSAAESRAGFGARCVLVCDTFPAAAAAAAGRFSRGRQTASRPPSRS